MKRYLLREWHGGAGYAAPRSFLTRCVTVALASGPPWEHGTSARCEILVGILPWLPKQRTARPNDFRHPKESQSRPQSWPSG